METRGLKPYFVVLALLVLTSLCLAFTVDVNLTNEAGIKVYLPEKVGNWTGQELRYCQNPACRRTFAIGDLEDPDVCPKCGSPLDGMSLAEKQILPEDTISLKKMYKNPAGNMIYASLVLSGKERGSIHRPEVCLVGQGRRIEGKSTLDIPLAGREDLTVMVLDLLDESRLPDGRSGPEFESYYAYWFVGKGRETPYHWQRVLWMGWDRIFKNKSDRWAYLAVGGGRSRGSDAYRAEIRDFIEDFYPQIQFN